MMDVERYLDQSERLLQTEDVCVKLEICGKGGARHLWMTGDSVREKVLISPAPICQGIFDIVALMWQEIDAHGSLGGLVGGSYGILPR